MTFAFGMLLVAIQVSGGQLTPRIVATTLPRDNTIRFSLALFVYTLMLAVSVKLRAERISPFLLSVASILGLISTATFPLLIDYSARMLRPVSIVSRVGNLGLEVFEHGRGAEPAGQAARRSWRRRTSSSAVGPPRRSPPHRGSHSSGPWSRSNTWSRCPTDAGEVSIRASTGCATTSASAPRLYGAHRR